MSYDFTYMRHLKNKTNECLKISCPDKISRVYVTFFFCRFSHKAVQRKTATVARKLTGWEPTRSRSLPPDFSAPFSRGLLMMAGSEKLDLFVNREMFSSF